LIEDCCQSYRYCLPNKIFEYLQAGLPIITSPLPVLSKFVGSQGIGVVSRKMTIESIQKSMIELQNIPQSPLKNRIKKTATNWCWDKEKAILLDFYEHILKK
jgi:glycosyltransferase involved in cell wall biosynthesis